MRTFLPVQKVAGHNFDLLKENPTHPSLHFKKVGKLWSVRVGPHYRALAVEDVQISFGFGSDLMMSMSDASNSRANSVLQWFPYSNR